MRSRHARLPRDAYWSRLGADAVFDGKVLGFPGAEVREPALIEEPYTVVVLPPDAIGQRLDDLGRCIVTPRAMIPESHVPRRG